MRGLHRVYVHADDGDAFALAAAGIGCTEYEHFPFRGKVVGYLDVPNVNMTLRAREDGRLRILPNRHSAADHTHHAKHLSIEDANSIRDIFTHLYRELQVEAFHPDL